MEICEEVFLALYKGTFMAQEATRKVRFNSEFLEKQ